MAGLDGLLEEQASIDSLLPSEVEGKEPLANRATNLKTAAEVAMLDDNPEGLEGTFRSTYQELEAGATPDATSEMMFKFQNKDMAEAQRAYIDILADPEISDEQKLQATQGMKNITSGGQDLSTMLAYKSLSEDELDSNGETEYVRVSLADAIDDVQSYNREAQKIYNEGVMGSSTNGAEFLADFITIVIPFTEAKFAAGIANDLRNGKDGAWNEALSTLGSLKMDMKEMLTKLPPSERKEFARIVQKAVRDNANILPLVTNDYAKMDMMKTFFEDGHYEDAGVWIDNTISVLDMIGLGGVLKRPLKAAARAGKGTVNLAASRARDAMRRSFGSDVQPASPSQTLKDVNSSKAKAVHEMAMADETGEVAEATYGTTREQVAKHDHGPEIATESGAVKAKVSNIDSIYNNRTEAQDEIFEYVENSGATYYQAQDKANLRYKVVNDFEQVFGMSARKEMFQTELSDGVKIKGVYGPTKSGYSSAESAMHMAMWALRDYNISEDAITLLVREGGEYVPTTLQEVKKREAVAEFADKLMQAKTPKAKGFQELARKEALLKKRQPDYLIQIDHTYKFNPNDIAKLEEADVKWNIWDYLPVFKGKMKSGSLQQHMMDSASNMHKSITISGNRSADASAELDRKFLNLAQGFAKKVDNLEEGRVEALTELIKRANHDGIEYTDTQMKALGLTPDEIDAMKSWREYWDTVYWVENRDKVKTLRNRGYKEFIDTETQTKLHVKPIGKAGHSNGAKVYNPATDSIEFKGAAEIEELYKKNGTLAQMIRPMVVGDDAVELVAVTESPGKSYLRGLTNQSQVLEYRKGYYSVHYKDPYFVDEIVRDKNGKELFRRAIASAGSRRDAEALAQRKREIDPDSTSAFVARQDKKGEIRGDSDYWDLQQARGRSAQRVRGKRLEGSTSNIEDLSTAPILGPVDTMVLSARSISNRVAMRDMIEVSKKRFMQQFEDYLPLHPVTKQPTYPNSVSDLSYRGDYKESYKRLADARTTYNHLRYLEDGYINQLDDGYKAILRALSDMAGNAGATKLEKAGLWAANKRGPAAMSKNIAFKAYLATNPIRQFIIQSHQALQLAANFPQWMVSQRAVPEMIHLITMQLTGKPNKWALKGLGLSEGEGIKLYKQWMDSGLAASIDKQNLLRGSLEDLTDEVTRKEIGIINFMRKVGFDAGENINMMTAWLAHRDAAVRAGKNIDDLEVLDTIAGEARNYTYNMNFAGDMPYNQNALSTIFQFFQVPHKAFLSMTFNRALTPMQKFRLAMFNGLMYGPPAHQALNLYGDLIPEEQGFARDTMVNGLEGALFNKTLTLMSGEETYVNWDSLAPLNLYGFYEMTHALFTTDLASLVAESPSGSLFFGNNPRLTNFAKSAVSMFAYVPGVEGDPVKFSLLAKDFLSISSGMSNMFKALYMKEVGKKLSSSGDVVDKEVTSIETLMQVAGFGPQDESNYYWVNMEMYKKSKEFEEDVVKVYNEVKRRLIGDNITPGTAEYYQQVLQQPWLVFGNDNMRARQILDRELRRDMANGDVRLYKMILDAHDIMSPEETKSIVDALPDVPQDMKDKYKDTIDATIDYKDKFNGGL